MVIVILPQDWAQSPHALLDQIQDTERCRCPSACRFSKGFVASHCLVLQIANLVLGSHFGPVLYALWMFCHSIRLFCVWASRRQESPCSSLVRHRAAWNHQRTPFQQRLGAQMGTVFAACVAVLFSNMARFWVRFSCPFLGQAYWRVQLEYPFLGPKYGLQVGAKKQFWLQLFVSASLATSRGGALEQFHEFLLSVCWVVLPRKRGKIKSRIQEEWSQAASRYAPTQKRRIL